MNRPTQRDRVRRHLEQYGSITNIEAVAMKILRLSERIRELEADGLVLSTSREEHGVYRYTLAGGPKPKLVAVMGENGVRLVPETYAQQQGLSVL
jgi:hypothetical protein